MAKKKKTAKSSQSKTKTTSSKTQETSPTVNSKVLYLVIPVVLIVLGFVLYSFIDTRTQTPIQSEEKIESTNPQVVLQTNYGNITLELYLEESPITAGNFKKLVEEGFYDGIKFHRIVPGFVIQAGDPQSRDEALKFRWGSGGSDPIQDEFIEGLSNTRGTLSMANRGPNTGSSQFFINLDDNVALDWNVDTIERNGQMHDVSRSKHPVFGKVITGLNVVYEIAGVETEKGGIPKDPVIIEKAYIK